MAFVRNAKEAAAAPNLNLDFESQRTHSLVTGKSIKRRLDTPQQPVKVIRDDAANLIEEGKIPFTAKTIKKFRLDRKTYRYPLFEAFTAQKKRPSSK